MIRILNSNLKFEITKANFEQSIRTFHLCLVNNLKKIEKTVNNDQKLITIEGKYLDVSEPNVAKTLPLSNEVIKFDTENLEHTTVRPCSFCELEKKGIYVQYKDVLILRQFLTDDGNILPQKVTGLCYKQYKKLRVMRKHAIIAGLILNLQPKLIDGSEPDVNPRHRYQHLKWNSYFEDYEILKRKNKYL